MLKVWGLVNGEGDDPHIVTFSLDGRARRIRREEDSAGQQSKRIRLRFEGGCEDLDLPLGDRVRIDDLEVHPGGEEHADDT